MRELFVILLILIILCVIYFRKNIITNIGELSESFKNIGNTKNNFNKINLKTSHIQEQRHKGKLNGSGDNRVDSVLYLNQVNQDTNAGLKYYQNDTIDQSKINENSYDIVNQIDLIDYGNVKTGMDKCQEKCDGQCLEFGYTGSTTCYPEETIGFDYGTLYKNPTFSYGTNAYKPTIDTPYNF
jgi:hypothetical protein